MKTSCICWLLRPAAAKARLPIQKRRHTRFRDQEFSTKRSLISCTISLYIAWVSPLRRPDARRSRRTDESDLPGAYRRRKRRLSGQRCSRILQMRLELFMFQVSFYFQISVPILEVGDGKVALDDAKYTGRPKLDQLWQVQTASRLNS